MQFCQLIQIFANWNEFHYSIESNGWTLSQLNKYVCCGVSNEINAWNWWAQCVIIVSGTLSMVIISSLWIYIIFSRINSDCIEHFIIIHLKFSRIPSKTCFMHSAAFFSLSSKSFCNKNANAKANCSLDRLQFTCYAFHDPIPEVKLSLNVYIKVESLWTNPYWIGKIAVIRSCSQFCFPLFLCSV